MRGIIFTISLGLAALLGACGVLDRATFLGTPDISQTGTSTRSQTSWPGDFQAGYQRVADQMKACLPPTGRNVKALQLTPGQPAEISIFRERGQGLDPFPSDLLHRISLSPGGTGGIADIETTQIAPPGANSAVNARITAWAQGQVGC